MWCGGVYGGVGVVRENVVWNGGMFVRMVSGCGCNGCKCGVYISMCMGWCGGSVWGCGYSMWKCGV